MYIKLINHTHTDNNPLKIYRENISLYYFQQENNIINDDKSLIQA